MSYLDPETQRVDIKRFTHALCKALAVPSGTPTPAAGEPDPWKRGAILFDGRKAASLGVSGRYRLVIRPVKGFDHERVSISIAPDDIPRSFAVGSVPEAPLPRVNVTITRPIMQIAYVVKQRIIGVAAAPIATRRLLAEQSQQAGDMTRQNAALIASSFPTFEVTEKTSREWKIKADGADDDGVSFAARLTGDVVTLEKFSVSVSQFMAMMYAVSTQEAQEGAKT